LIGKRIVRRGSVAALIQASENLVDEEKVEHDAVRMLPGHFDLNDFSEQVHLLEQKGPCTETAEEIPGLAQALSDGTEIDDSEFDRIGAIVSSMTEEERRHPSASWSRVGRRSSNMAPARGQPPS
jgi:signal recognition particle subunit SRP54